LKRPSPAFDDGVGRREQVTQQVKELMTVLAKGSTAKKIHRRVTVMTGKS
jgi:hypothetical protein